MLYKDRLTIPETPRYTFDVARDIEQAQDDVKAYIQGKHEGHPDELARATVNQAAKEQLEVPRASFRDFCRHYGKSKNFLLLLGTAGSWFCLDVAFYGLSLNNGVILDAIGYSTSKTTNMYEFMYNTAVGNVIIVLAGAVPGYWVTVATVDTIGRKTIQLGGFIILTVLFVIMGFAYHKIPPNGLLAIYVIAQFFFNFGKPTADLQSHLVVNKLTRNVFLGPNATTFIVPGEVFPTRYRSTSHGISAASGKIGSIIGQGAISTLRTHGATKTNANPWLDHVLEIYALFMLLGCFTTLLIPETRRKTLEELSNENDYAVRSEDVEAEPSKSL